MRLQECVADCVQQMRFALTGRGLEIERAELRFFRRSHTLCRIIGEDVGLTRNEGSEGE